MEDLAVAILTKDRPKEFAISIEHHYKLLSTAFPWEA